MENFPFLTDILTQPESVQKVVDGFDPKLMADLRQRVAHGDFDRIIITGMGASTFGSYPAWITLAQAGLPAFWMDTSELLTATPGMITPRTLLWVISNSGKSIEITRLLNRLGEFGSPFVLANSNDMESPLAQKANLTVPMYSGNDLTLSTRSYVATIAVTQLMARLLAGKDIQQELDDLRITAQGLAEYTAQWEQHLARLDEQIGKINRLAIAGRGYSYATALEGALCFKEGPKFNAEGLSTGQFWHGPVELADPTYTVLTMAGSAATQAEDIRLARKALSLGAKVLWFADQADSEVPSVILPKNRGIGLPIAEIVPIQLISINAGKQSGWRPGDFRYLGTIVSTKKEM
jgi:glutamine---fructose-6-phosphate transaminase (isomerizing)